MRKFILSVSIIAALSSVSYAGQWDDAIQWEDVNYRIPFESASSPTTDLFATWDAATCTTPMPSYFLNTAPTCLPSGEQRININEFARQRDLLNMTGQLASVSSEFSAMRAQFVKSLQSETRSSSAGIAQALAMAGTADLQTDENYAVSMNLGTFRGQTAFAGAAVARLSSHVSFNAGVSAGANGGPVGARAGIRFGW